MKAIEFLKEWKYLPVSVLKTPNGRPSNSELRKWLSDGAVKINGLYPKPSDEVIYPIKELIFFPSGKRQTTLLKE